MYRERGTQAEINTAHISHNIKIFKKLHPGRVIAVVKADAYGHGLSTVVPHLSDCDAFAVATISEALELRNINDNKRIILLEGVFNHDELDLAIEKKFDVVVHQHYQIDLLKAHVRSNEIDAWLKIDTGMGRLGFEPEDAEQQLAQLQQAPVIKQTRIMAHFASADVKYATQTQDQISHNNQLKQLGVEYSFSNTAAVLNELSDDAEWIRVGIGLFGISPLHERWASEFSLKPVMELTAKLIATKRIKAGSKVGYGGTFVASQDQMIGIVGIGYADGYPWSNNPSHVVIDGCKVAVIGRVSMDMMAVDLSEIESIKTGTVVYIWGEQWPIEAVANELGVIPYTLPCGITKRVKFNDIQ